MPLKTTEVPAQALRREAGDLLGRIQYQHERVIITKHGKPIVAMVPIEDLVRIESALKKAKSNDQEYVTFESAMSEAVSLNPKNIGSDFDSFLKEEGIYDEVKAESRKRVEGWLRSRLSASSLKRMLKRITPNNLHPEINLAPIEKVPAPTSKKSAKRPSKATRKQRHGR
jgi:prevent-host-death family protein